MIGTVLGVPLFQIQYYAGYLLIYLFISNPLTAIPQSVHNSIPIFQMWKKKLKRLNILITLISKLVGS